MYKLEQFLISIYQYEQKYDDYAKIHDRFISEIDADIKGNRNLKAFAGKYNLPVNPDYIELFNTYNIFRENNYEPLFFINQFNKKIKEHPEIFRMYKSDSTFRNNRIYEFYDDNGNLRPINEIMNLVDNPILPYIVSSLDFIKSINNKQLSNEQIQFVYNNIKNVIDEHNDKQEKAKIAKEKLEPRFDEFIEYTKISNKSSKSLEVQNYSELYKYLEAILSTLKQYISVNNKLK